MSSLNNPSADGFRPGNDHGAFLAAVESPRAESAGSNTNSSDKQLHAKVFGLGLFLGFLYISFWLIVFIGERIHKNEKSLWNALSGISLVIFFAMLAVCIMGCILAYRQSPEQQQERKALAQTPERTIGSPISSAVCGPPMQSRTPLRVITPAPATRRNTQAVGKVYGPSVSVRGPGSPPAGGA